MVARWTRIGRIRRGGECPESVKVVVKPKSVMGEWVGMNAAAVPATKFPHRVPEGELWVCEGTNQGEVALHEAIEYMLMRCRGMMYKEAHDLTNRLEVRIRGK